MPISRLLLLLAVALLLSGCGGLGLTWSPDPDAVLEADIALAESVADARQAAEARPDDAQALVRYADALGLAHSRGTILRGRLAGESMVEDALTRLDAALADEGHAPTAAELLAARGWLLRRTDDPGGGVDDLVASLQRYPNLRALRGAARALAADASALADHCRATFELTPDEAGRIEVLELCRAARPEVSASSALSWAGRDGVALYERAMAEQREASAVQWNVQTTSSTTRNGVTTTSTQSSGGGYGGRVHLTSSCSMDVWLYLGELDDPLIGDGAFGTHTAGASETYWLGPDDRLCLMTPTREVVSCVKPRDGDRLRIAESCAGFSAR